MATQGKTRGGQTSRRSEHGRSGNENRNSGGGSRGGGGGGSRRSGTSSHGRTSQRGSERGAEGGQQPSRQSARSGQASSRGSGNGNGSGSGLMHRGVNTLSDSVKNHPVPALVVGAGLGYLAALGLRRSAPQASRISEGARGVLETVGEGIGGAAETTKEALGTAGETIKEGATKAWHGAERGLSKAGSALREGASAVGQSAERAFETSREAVGDTWEKHPLMVCAAVLAAGAAAGLLLPRTRAEDQTLGK